MSQSSKRAANPGSSPPPNATKRPRGETAKASAGGADAAKPPEKTDAGDALGRIFVAVRIRPLNAREREGSSAEQATPRFSALDGTRVVETRPARVREEDKGVDAAPTAAPAWEADAVFDADDDNAAVYARTAKSVVDAVLRGVNGTVMAYGQTSSGKTHTMSGTAEDPGVMTRAMEDIFAAVDAAGDARAFEIKASYMEIYNEEIRDLLAPDAGPEANGARASFTTAGGGLNGDSASNASTTNGTRVKLVNGPRGLTRVIGLEERLVTGSRQIIDLVEEGTRKRSVGRTAMNASSSRSHAVLRISVNSSPNPGHALTGPPLNSTLYVVDLAGSERADPNAARTKKQTQLKKEGSNINQSLLTLRLCVQRLAKAYANAGTNTHSSGSSGDLERDKTSVPSRGNEKNEPAQSVGHVPYRDSKLTRILQPALAGPGRTAIVAAVTPASSHVNETYSTLNFVAVAKSVKLEARVNRALGSNAKAHDSEALKELQARVAAEAIRRESLEEEHERALEEMSNVGARLSAAESRADAAAAAAEFAERAAASARERAKAADARAEAAERERDATAAHAASAASRFMDAKSGSRSEAASLRAALEALEAEKAESDATKADTEKALADAAASLAQAQEETARAQAEATAAREAEDAALSTAARELEAADATRAALESTLRGEVDAEKARCAAMKASLERARGRVVDAEKTAKLAKEETAGLSLRLRMAEEALSEARAGNEKMGFAEQKQLTLEIERRVAVEQALDETERRCVVLDAESGALRASLARAETNAENAVQALEQERSAAKELDEAATMALGEVERLAADAARLEKALAEQTALTDEARVDLEMTREELAEACRVSGKENKENEETRDDRFASARACDKSEEVSPLSPGFAVKASTAMRASRKPAEAAPAAVARAERVVEEEAAEGVDALVVASAATQSAVLETVAVAVDAAAGETLSEEPKKRGRGRPKKARTEAEQRFVDLKAKKKRAAPSAPFETTGAADEENAGASVGVGFSLKSLIIAAGVSKKRPALGAADANASDAPSKAKETEHLPAARKRRRLAAVSSLRDVIGSPLENGRFLR